MNGTLCPTCPLSLKQLHLMFVRHAQLLGVDSQDPIPVSSLLTLQIEFTQDQNKDIPSHSYCGSHGEVLQISFSHSPKRASLIPTLEQTHTTHYLSAA